MYLPNIYFGNWTCWNHPEKNWDSTEREIGRWNGLWGVIGNSILLSILVTKHGVNSIIKSPSQHFPISCCPLSPIHPITKQDSVQFGRHNELLAFVHSQLALENFLSPWSFMLLLKHPIYHLGALNLLKSTHMAYSLACNKVYTTLPRRQASWWPPPAPLCHLCYRKPTASVPCYLLL